MSASDVALAVAGGYLAACLLVGILPGRKASASAEGYVAGDRTLGLLVMYFITGATIFSAFAFLGAPGWAYSRGVAGLYILAYGALGFVPFYALGPRALRLGREYGFVTQGELVAKRFSSRTLALCAALIAAVAFIPYLALQMKGAGMVVATVSEGRVGEEVGAALVYGVVALYVLKSGVLGVGWTNTFQGVFMMGLAWYLGLRLPGELYGGVGPMFERLTAERPELLRSPGLTGAGEPWSFSEYTSAVVVSILGFSFWPHLFMKAFTARDEATLRRTVVLYPTFQLFLVPILLVGFSGVLFEPAPAKPDQVLPHLLMHMDLSPFVIGLFCAGALAASMSSGDAMAHACASIVVRDGARTGLAIGVDSARERRWIRIGVGVVLLGAYAFAIGYKGSLVTLLLYAYGPVAQLAPGVLAALTSRRATSAGVIAGLVVGIVVNIAFVIDPGLRPWPVHGGLLALTLNAAVLIAVSAMTRARDPEADQAFLAVASGEAPTPENARPSAIP